MNNVSCCYATSFSYLIYFQDCDEFAIRSQKLWGEANEKGIFAAEMAPVEIITKKGTKVRTYIPALRKA